MDETRFYYSTDGTDSLGPVPPSALRKLYEDGVISTDSFLCLEGETTWAPFDPASLPEPEPAPAPVVAPVKTVKIPTKALPETKTATRPAYRAETKAEAKPETKTEAKPKTEFKPRTEFKPKPELQLEPAPVAQFVASADEEWETERIKIIAWGLCGFVAFDTALFLTWQRPAVPPHSTLSTVLFFVGEIFFVLVLPVLISRAVPRRFRYRAQAGLTVLLALIFIGLRFALPSGRTVAVSAPTPSTNTAPGISLVTPPPTNAPAAAVETSSSSTNAASLAVPETNAAPEVAPALATSTNAASGVTPPPAPTTNAAPAITSEPSTNAAPVPPAPPTPPPVPAVDPAAIARDVQKVSDALTEKVKASVAAEAACPNFNPATITTHDNVTQRQAAITAWQTMQSNVLSYLQSYDDHVRDALAHQNLDEKDLAAAVTDARNKNQVDQLVVLWQLKIKLSSDQLARLLFLDKSWDHWSGKTGKLVFDDKDVLNDYTNFLVTLQQDVKEIADIQKQITPTP